MTTQEITLPVTGMTCAMCVKNVERSLKRADGVAEVNVNLATERAKVEFDGDKLEALPTWLPGCKRPATASPPPQIDLPITGMTCAMCQKNVSRALSKAEGRHQRQMSISPAKRRPCLTCPA